jgi:thioredoxin reductase (NADPH)
MTESPRQKPVILLVATGASRDVLEDEFRSRYSRDYDVRTLLGPGGCVEAATQLVADGRRIALLGVDHALDGDALDLVDELRRLSPTSRRIVLVSSGTFREALEVLRPALAVGRLDTYLLIPQGPRDEEFHTAITEYLSEWATTASTPTSANSSRPTALSGR